MNSFSKQRIAIIGLIAAVGLLISAIILSLSSSGALNVSSAYATNLAYAHQVSPNEINYFTGTSFASYNNSTHSTESFTPQYSLPRIVSDVAWSKDAAIFQATGYSDVDQLYPELVRKNLSPNSPYWWLVNFKTGAISLIGSNSNHYSVNSVVWLSNSHYLTSEQPEEGDKRAVTSYDFSGKATPIGHLPTDAILVGGTADQLIYTVANNATNDVVALDPKTGQGHKILTGVIKVLVGNPDGSVMALTQDKTEQAAENLIGDLVYYNAGTKKTKTITTGFSGNAIWVPYSNTWIASGTGSDGGQVFTVVKNKTSAYSIKAPDSEAKYQERGAVGLAGKDILLTTPKKELVIASAKTPKPPALPDFSAINGDIDNDTFRILYVAEQNQYSVYIKQPHYESNRQAVLAYLRQKGFDPNQLKLKWYAYDTVDTGFYLPPDTTPVEDPIPIEPETIDDGD